MPMKPSSPNRPAVSAAAARNAFLVNQFATPGLGSLMAHRWIAGSGQLGLAVLGFVLVMVWFFKVMIEYYGQITGDVPIRPVAWIGELGAALFILAWIWSLFTSISLLRHCKDEPVPPTLPASKPQ